MATAKGTTDNSKVTKALYAAVGAPVVAGRRVRVYGTKLAGYRGKVVDGFNAQYTVWAEEGEDVTKQIQDRNVVGDIQEKVDLEQLQDRVGKLREQLEHTMVQWRESFTPATKPADPKPAVKPEAAAPEKKPAAKKPVAKKTTKAASATKSTATTAAKKTTAKATASKATTSKATTSKATTSKATTSKAATSK